MRPVLHLLPALAPLALVALGQGYPKLAPFARLRWKADVAEVEVRGRWWRLESIDGFAPVEIREFADRTWPGKGEKRFAEDLVEVMTRMGKPPRATVRLVVADLETGERQTLSEIELTHENRQALWASRKGLDREPAARSAAVAPEPAPTPRIERVHASSVAPEHAPLVRRLDARERLAPRLSRREAEEDLDALEGWIEARYAYRGRLGFDYRRALDSIRAALGEGISRASFALQLARLLARFGDGHSRLEEDAASSDAWLPFRVQEAGACLLALPPDRAGFLSPERPCIRAIDGVPIERWIEAAGELAPRGAPHLHRRHALRNLRALAHLRSELGLPAKASVDAELSDLHGARRETVSFPVATQKPAHGDWPSRGSALLEGNFGYLRIASMDGAPAALEAIDGAMDRFRETRGLVVDVRGNGGGSRAILRRFFPYLQRPGEPPAVANVAYYRLGPGEQRDASDGHLADRFLWPERWSGWSSAERASIRAFAPRFAPEWPPPPSEFSEAHYLVLSRDTNPRAFSYEAPVAVLLDAGCFSATDVFLAALAGRPGVTLFGEPSGGGSGRARAYPLPRSGLRVRLSSMVSFRRDGRLYDGRGIEPDRRVEPAPEDLAGHSDRVLEESLRYLRAR